MGKIVSRKLATKDSWVFSKLTKKTSKKLTLTLKPKCIKK